MNACLRLCLTALVAIVPLAATATTLTPFSAELEAIRHGLVDIKARGTLRLSRDGDQWHYRLSTDGNTLFLREESWLTFEDGVLRPQRYTSETKVFWSRNTKRLDFDHDSGRVTGVVEDERISEAFDTPIYDAIGYQLELQQRLRAGDRDIEMGVFRDDETDDFTFRVVGEERLRLPGGTADTLVIEQTAPLGSDERKRIWIAPRMGYVPLRFTREEDGRMKEEIRVLSLTLDGETVDFND